MNIKRFCKDAPLPVRKTNGAVGYDLPACAKRLGYDTLIDYEGNIIYPNNGKLLIPLGWGFEIWPGFKGELEPRSSTRDWLLDGVIDWDYRGQLSIKTTVQLLRNAEPRWEIFDRIAQISFVEVRIDDDLVEVPELSPTARGAGGHGSTGR